MNLYALQRFDIALLIQAYTHDAYLKDGFRSIDEDGPSLPDLAPDTTQGAVYRLLPEHADLAFRQREIVDAIYVPEESVGPRLKRLGKHDLSSTAIASGRLLTPSTQSRRLDSTVPPQPTSSTGGFLMTVSRLGWRLPSTSSGRRQNRSTRSRDLGWLTAELSSGHPIRSRRTLNPSSVVSRFRRADAVS